MKQVTIHLKETIEPNEGDSFWIIHRPPEEVKFETYGAVVDHMEGQTLIIPWSQVAYATIDDI